MMKAKERTLHIAYTDSEGNERTAQVNYTMNGSKSSGSAAAHSPEEAAAIEKAMSAFFDTQYDKRHTLEHWPNVIIYQFPARSKDATPCPLQSALL